MQGLGLGCWEVLERLLGLCLDHRKYFGLEPILLLSCAISLGSNDRRASWLPPLLVFLFFDF